MMLPALPKEKNVKLWRGNLLVTWTYHALRDYFRLCHRFRITQAGKLKPRPHFIFVWTFRNFPKRCVTVVMWLPWPSLLQIQIQNPNNSAGHLMRFQSETTVLRFLRRSVTEAGLGELDITYVAWLWWIMSRIHITRCWSILKLKALFSEKHQRQIHQISGTYLR